MPMLALPPDNCKGGDILELLRFCAEALTVIVGGSFALGLIEAAIKWVRDGKL